MTHPQHRFAFAPELIVDLFAGGGGASLGIEQAFGRPVDIAVNHDATAVSVHAANHPQTQHYTADVFEVDAVEATGGRPVGLLWASPDCKHFSKAKGGKPRSKKIRALAWVVVRWAKTVRPRVIILENVEEFVTWGPLVAGQPCRKRRGQTFQRWLAQLRACGYQVEHRELRACDYGAPTIRKRFFLIARCDGLPIRWPKPTHGKPDSADVRAGRLLPWRSAAECIDWHLPCPSIFLSREEGRAIGVKRPLAEATMRRIARGVERFVINAARPFIVNTRNGERAGQDPRVRSVADPLPTVTAQGSQGAIAVPVITEHANTSRAASWRADEPLRTACAEVKGGHFALAAAFLTKYRADNAGADVAGPWPTITANGESDRPGGNAPIALVAAHLEQANTGVVGHDPRKPLSTIVGKGSTQRLAVSHLSKLYGTSTGADPGAPAPTVTASGNHLAEVRAFLTAYYGSEQDGIDPADPMRTVVSRERFGLVTVDGTDYAIADIGLRMLTTRELFRAQGFPDTYIIDRDATGRRLPKDAQVRLCGNSVCPPIARALVEANVGELLAIEQEERAA